MDRKVSPTLEGAYDLARHEGYEWFDFLQTEGPYYDVEVRIQIKKVGDRFEVLSTSNSI
jgi:hypothetical protein